MVKQYQVLLSLCVALAMAGSVFGGVATCTPATCGDGPVRAYFQYSNCSGDVFYSPIERNWGVCEEGFLAEKNEYGFSDRWFYGGGADTCDIGAANTTYWFEFYKYGACIPNGELKRSAPGRQHRSESMTLEASYLYLPNVNASFISPQTFDNQPLPAFSNYERFCEGGVDNCVLDNGQASQLWYTYYSGLECQNPSSSYSNPSILANTCYNYYNTSYYLVGCVDEHTTYYSYYTDAACSEPAFVWVWNDHCGPDNQYTNYCTATPTPIPSFIPTSPPTSSASFNQISFSLAIITCLIAFTMF